MHPRKEKTNLNSNEILQAKTFGKTEATKTENKFSRKKKRKKERKTNYMHTQRIGISARESFLPDE